MTDGTSDDEKPTLQLLGAPITAPKLAEMFRRLTGREPTADGMERFRQAAERIEAKRVRKNDQRFESTQVKAL